MQVPIPPARLRLQLLQIRLNSGIRKQSIWQGLWISLDTFNHFEMIILHSVIIPLKCHIYPERRWLGDSFLFKLDSNSNGIFWRNHLQFPNTPICNWSFWCTRPGKCSQRCIVAMEAPGIPTVPWTRRRASHEKDLTYSFSRNRLE